MNKLFSVNRAVEYDSLRSIFENHIFFSEGKVGYIIFSDTLENVTAEVADSYVEKGYHVGFLTDTSDAAQAYAVPNASFRVYLRGLSSPVDNLQKMMSHPSLLISTDIGLTGDFQDFGLNWFVGITRYLKIAYQANITGYIPNEICNLKLTHSLGGEIDFTQMGLVGEIPKDIGKMGNIVSINLPNNNLTGIIPPEIGDLSGLVGLTLSSNNLSGSIPRKIGNLSNLSVLSLRQNYTISGTIPVELGNCTKLNSLSLHRNALSDYEKGAISINQNLLTTVSIYEQSGTSTATGLPSTAIDNIIIDMADCVLVNGQENGTLNVSYNYPPTSASITDAIERFGNISAKAFLESKGWTVTHS